MPSHLPSSPPISISISLLLLVLLLPFLSAAQLPNPGGETSAFQPKQPYIPNPTPTPTSTSTSSPSPPTTIPSFPEPEQSAVAGCPISLPDEMFPAVRSSCTAADGEIKYGPLHRSRCCPVLAAWLYSAYSATALGTRTQAAGKGAKGGSTTAAPSYEMPMLPDDSETCVDGLENAMREKGVELGRPNASCDVLYCYCGIRLHQLSCPAAFRFRMSTQNQKGEEGDYLSGDENVERFEKDCLPPVDGRHPGKGESNHNSNNGGIVGCSKCLNSLYKLNKGNSNKGGDYSSSKSSVEEVRTSKMRSRDCELMGLTWLLNKNRTAYLHTVTLVLRSLMVADEDGSSQHGSSLSGPVSCGLNRDGMPLAVDSSEISAASTSKEAVFLLLSICLMCVSFFSVSLLEKKEGFFIFY